MRPTHTGTLVAIDPGTDNSGVAIYENGVLVMLMNPTLPALVVLLEQWKRHNTLVVVEDVEAIKAMYSRNTKSRPAEFAKVAQNVGMVKATARHIFSFLEAIDLPHRRIKPMGGNWGTISTAQGRKALKQSTGWTAKSNKDTRSAAFLGWVYLNRQRFSA